MNREQVTSSTVASLGYDAGTMTLEVEFVTGFVYQYFDVPEFEYQNLVTAESIGRYFNQNIRNSYRYGRI
jgi:hypothetical protein